MTIVILKSSLVYTNSDTSSCNNRRTWNTRHIPHKVSVHRGGTTGVGDVRYQVQHKPKVNTSAHLFRRPNRRVCVCVCCSGGKIWRHCLHHRVYKNWGSLRAGIKQNYTGSVVKKSISTPSNASRKCEEGLKTVHSGFVWLSAQYWACHYMKWTTGTFIISVKKRFDCLNFLRLIW